MPLATAIRGLHATVSLSYNYADLLILNLNFGESWQHLIRQAGIDSNSVLMHSCKSLPFCRNLALLDTTRFAVRIDVDSVIDQEGLLPSRHEIEQLLAALLLVLEELSGLEWSYELADGWRDV